MSDEHLNKHEELMELNHEPLPGYRPVFYVIMTIASLYLAFIIFKAL